jgi:hypothetical protein
MAIIFLISAVFNWDHVATVVLVAPSLFLVAIGVFGFVETLENSRRPKSFLISCALFVIGLFAAYESHVLIAHYLFPWIRHTFNG